MIKVTIKRTGSINPTDLAQKMMRQLEDSLTQDYRRKLAGVRCPAHGTQPHLELQPRPGGYNLKLLNECCPAFADLCEQKIK
ncbi:hypothetical protein [Hymenobacter koreensis]|uniref:Uncharacterized protein n=1 Tax=Hymenobacter koreensis TaxID=1084523 RepID=A0ABP8JNV3_9BACT